jgi:hypothetical protein
MRRSEGGDPLGGLWSRLLWQQIKRMQATSPSRDTQRELRESAGAKLIGGHNLTREEVAAHLGVSGKKIQRMETAGLLTRCPGLGTVVRFAARDVLRLASASSRKGA